MSISVESNEVDAAKTLSARVYYYKCRKNMNNEPFKKITVKKILRRLNI